MNSLIQSVDPKILKRGGTPDDLNFLWPSGQSGRGHWGGVRVVLFNNCSVAKWSRVAKWVNIILDTNDRTTNKHNSKISYNNFYWLRIFAPMIHSLYPVRYLLIWQPCLMWQTLKWLKSTNSWSNHPFLTLTIWS